MTDRNLSVIVDCKIGHETRVNDQVNLYRCKIGSHCKIDSFVYVEEGVEIGDYTRIRPFTFIPTGVKIGSRVFIGPAVTFTNDRYPKIGGAFHLETTSVEDDAAIGAGSTILPGVTIGRGALVGAGSIVTKSIPEGCRFVAGKIVRT